MQRTAIVVWIGSMALCALGGCAHMLETQAIENFTFALQDQDLEQLQDASSEEFGERALRRTEALDDLKILRLPKEPPTVVDVVEISPDERRVNVTVAEGRTELLYKLVRTADEKWVVDDIYMQKKKQGLKVIKSVSEQMDLLLSVRDFVASWETGGREDVLAVTTNQLGKELTELPPAYLQQVVQRIIGSSQDGQQGARPEAQMDKNVAIVTLPRLNGKLMISFRLDGEMWKVDDIALDARDEERNIASLAKTARVMNSAVRFLQAYEDVDKLTLKALTTDKFYRQSLLPADLASLPLASPQVPRREFQVSIYGDRATFVTSTGSEDVSIDLLKTPSGVPNVPDEYIVEEVTMYDSGTEERKRLSALFTSRDRIAIFNDALGRRDLAMIRSTSTPEFNAAVWQQVDEILVRALPIPLNEQLTVNFESSKFLGDYTEVTAVGADQTKVVYRLRDWNGELGIDDVLIPTSGQPTSLRDRLNALLPVYQFALGVHQQRIPQIQRHVSSDFNRLVWQQVDFVPEVGFPVTRHLQSPPTAIAISGERCTIQLGDDRWGARVNLVKEHGQWAIDELHLIAGPEPQQRTEMKENIRAQIATGKIHQPNASIVGGPAPRRVRQQPSPAAAAFQRAALGNRQPVDRGFQRATTPDRPLRDDFKAATEDLMPPIEIPLQ